jgi:hypothetical protein
VVFLFFILFFFLVKPVFAAPTVQITVAPSNAATGTDIPVQFIITNGDPSTLYHYKFFGGIGNSETQIQTSSSLYSNSPWLSHPSTTTDIGGSVAVYATAYIKTDGSSGIYNLFVKISKEDTGTIAATSPAYIINNVIGPTPTPTSAPTNTPTPDSTVSNPTSGISLTEFMPYSSIEWVEIYNSNSHPVKLSGWKLADNSSNTKSLPDLTISANGYTTYDFSNLLNNDGDTITLINNSGQTVSQRIYENNKYSLDYSWSLINNSWCQASITKGYVNVTSCYTAPTATPTPTATLTPTPTIDQTKFTSSDTATESAIIEPTSESSYLSPTVTPIASPTVTTLNDDITNTTKKNYLPLILIVSGGLLLTSPLIISKLKK